MTDKKRFRWNSRRAIWHSVGWEGGLGSHYIGTCGFCGTVSVIGFKSKRCEHCKRDHFAKSRASAGPAHNAVAKAIRLGHLQELNGTVKCVDCGLPAQVYDHRDYLRPLDVVPVCRKCNCARGMAKQTREIRTAA